MAKGIKNAEDLCKKKFFEAERIDAGAKSTKSGDKKGSHKSVFGGSAFGSKVTVKKK